MRWLPGMERDPGTSINWTTNPLNYLILYIQLWRKREKYMHKTIKACIGINSLRNKSTLRRSLSYMLDYSLFWKTTQTLYACGVSNPVTRPCILEDYSQMKLVLAGNAERLKATIFHKNRLVNSIFVWSRFPITFTFWLAPQWLKCRKNVFSLELQLQFHPCTLICSRLSLVSQMKPQMAGCHTYAFSYCNFFFFFFSSYQRLVHFILH